MNLAISSLASGSSGNCYLITSGNTNILVDAGISGKQILLRLANIGCAKVDAILVSHEHSDHVAGLGVMVKHGVKLYINQKTLDAVQKDKKIDAHYVFNTGEKFSIGDINVSSFSLSHDAADPSGFSFEKDGKSITIITDTGYITDDCYSYMSKADILVLESNHDESMLRVGPYPWFLKQRILSDKGHLSNDAAAEGLVKILKLSEMQNREKDRIVLLAHLSKENNFPEMALATMENILERDGFSIGAKLKVETLSRDEQSKMYII